MVDVGMIAKSKDQYMELFTNIKNSWNDYTNLDLVQQDVINMMFLVMKDKMQYKLSHKLEITNMEEYNELLWMVNNFEEFSKL